MVEARLYSKDADTSVRCQLCAHRCHLQPGQTGLCGTRFNHEGTLWTRAYGRTIAAHVDPIEKKPLYHFHPGTTAFSVATPGCNFRCRWCQNYQISQNPDETDFDSGTQATPEDLATAAIRGGCHSIAYTYTEPTVFYEYTRDTALPAAAAGLANVYVTNGYMSQAMLAEAKPWLDAASVDLKAFREATYRKYMGARLQPVLDALKTMKAMGMWIEVTTLVIPGINDDDAEIRELAGFVAGDLGPETPWHVSRFFPTYRMTNVPPTPVEALQRVADIGRERGLWYVYPGNLPDSSSTTCHACNATLIRRQGYGASIEGIDSEGRCVHCRTPVDGVGMSAERR